MRNCIVGNTQWIIEMFYEIKDKLLFWKYAIVAI